MSEREKAPEEIPDEIVEAAMRDWRTPRMTVNTEPERTELRLRHVIASVWNQIYLLGYEHGFLDCEDDKVDKIVEMEAGYSPHLTIWADGATAEVAEKLFDSILDAADELAPDEVGIGAVGTMNPAAHKVIKKEE